MEEKDVYSELSSIRSLMERSSKFISLSGLSGVMAGIYALAGAFFAYRIVYRESGGLRYRDYYANDPQILPQLFFIALTVLILSITTGIWLTIRQARKKGEQFWNPVSKRLLSSLAIPLVTGGLFILLLLAKGHYDMIASSCLLFYGLSLIAGSQYTFTDVKWLGVCEIVLGLLATVFPGFGIVFWVLGFGLLHIIYGLMMHLKYNR